MCDGSRPLWLVISCHVIYHITSHHIISHHISCIVSYIKSHYTQGVPKKCIHTLNDYNSLKLSFFTFFLLSFFFFLYGDMSQIRFIAQNLQQSMSWKEQLKENAPKYQMKWFLMFAIPSVCIISSAWIRTVISSNTCNNSKNSTLVFFNLDYKT